MTDVAETAFGEVKLADYDRLRLENAVLRHMAASSDAATHAAAASDATEQLDRLRVEHQRAMRELTTRVELAKSRLERSARGAQAANEEQQRLVIEMLKAHGVADEDIQHWAIDLDPGGKVVRLRDMRQPTTPGE